MAVAPRPGHPLRFGLFELDFSTGELRREGRRVRLQEQPFRILSLLLEHPGELVTREELRQKLWPADTFVDFDDGLNAAVKKLRFALGDSSENPRFVETIPRRGYRFIAPVATGVEASAAALAESPAASARGWPRSRKAWIAGLAAAAVLALATVASLRSKDPSPSGTPFDPSTIRSIVVLPLKNLSNDPEQQYFADGMTEELITRLAALEGLRVISRTSAMQYKDTGKLLPQIASELHVDAIVEGSVLRAGHRIRITAQLVHGSSDRHLWAESYERDQRDVLELQNEVARDIAEKVRRKLRPALQARAPRDPEALQAYLRGRYLWHRRRGDELLKAIADFERAISIDPSYALAHAGLADCYIVLPFLSRVPQDEAYPKAREAADKALALDPTLAEAHNSTAYVKVYLDWDFAGAEQGFRRAIELNPNYATAHQWYAELLSYQGRHEEAIREVKKALVLDPLAAVMHHQAGQTYQQARQYDLAIQEYKNAIALDPWFRGPSSLFLSFAYRRQGRLDLAADAMQPVFVHDPVADKLKARMTTAAARGDTREYLRGQLGLADRLTRPAYYAGVAHAALGQDREALESLERAYQRHDEAILYVKVDPEWDHLRSDPRFVAVAKKVGLPQEGPADPQ